MQGFNQVILLGNVTKDAELRYTPNGTAVCSFSLAINRKYKQGDEMKEDVTYINISAWGKLAENCNQYVKKGMPVLISGRLQQRRWETDEGQKRSKHEVVADEVKFLGRPNGDEDKREQDSGGY